MNDDFKEIIARAQALAKEDAAAPTYYLSQGQTKKIINELGKRTKAQILESEQAEINWSRFAANWGRSGSESVSALDSPEGKKLFDESIKAETGLYNALQKAVEHFEVDPVTAQALVRDISKATGDYGFQQGGGQPAPPAQTPSEPMPALYKKPGRSYHA
jgi:hypothetical protein